MQIRDDDLQHFEAHGLSLPTPQSQATLDHKGARIWYATYGKGPAVILLHGGLGHSGNWAKQVKAITDAGFQVTVIDSRGHGKSTRDTQPYTYELMGSDVIAIMDALKIEKAAMIGWSDGACTALVLGRTMRDRVSGVFFFACNMDPSGTKEFKPTPIINRCFARHQKDYEAMSATPKKFTEFVEALNQMQRTEPNYSAQDLQDIDIPVTIALGENDEFIKRDHAEYLARNIPESGFILIPGVSHFAPIQRPDVFNNVILSFLKDLN